MYSLNSSYKMSISIDDYIEKLPDELQLYLMEYGIIKKNIYITENGIFKKKHIYEFQTKLNLDDKKYRKIKFFIKSYNEICIDNLTGTIQIIKLFPIINEMMYSWQIPYYSKKLSIIYKDDFIYCEYSNSLITLQYHAIQIFDNGDILFTYSPLLTNIAKQTVIRNKLYVKSNFIE